MKSEWIYKNKKYILVIATLLLSFALLVTASVAWFASLFPLEKKEFKGSSIAAYFAGGDGSKDDPYQIELPVHLYNLSWLQYLGIFNRDTDGDGKIEQKYFVLNNDVNMSGLVIPPIGTEENPFLGNFNGKNFCVSDVTVADYVSKNEGTDGGVQMTPSSVTEIDNKINDESDKSIVGFFGVVGDWDNTLGDKITDDTQEADKIDIPSKVNAIYDLRLNNLTVRSNTSQSLMGLAVGYANGSMQNIGVGKGTLVAGSNLLPLSLNVPDLKMNPYISHYSLIGEYDEDNVAWPNKPVLGGWGSTIDMYGLYNRLSERVIPHNDTKLVDYVSRIIITYDEDGNEISRTEEKEETNEIWQVNLPDGLGNFTFSTHTNNNAYGSKENVADYQYKYLYGPVSYDQEIVERRPSETQSYIASGTNYLSIERQGVWSSSYYITNTTQEEAVGWQLTADGFFRSSSVERYLNVNSDNELTLGTSGSTVWEKAETNGIKTVSCTKSGIKYYLYYMNDEWGLHTETDETGYTISSGNNYLNLNGDTITNGTNSDTATIWTFSQTNPFGGTIYSNGYYLTVNYTNRRYSISANANVQNSNNSKSTFNGNTNNNLYCTVNNSTRYIRYNNGWGLTTSASQSRLTITPVSRILTYEDFGLDFPTYYAETTTTSKQILCPDATWTPLLTGFKTVEENGVESEEEYVLPNNTGYIVSGSDFDQNDGTLKRAGNIRVSKYSKSTNVANSLQNNELNHSEVYTISYKNKTFGTIDSTNNAESGWGFSKYTNSSEQFNGILKTTLPNSTTIDSNVYGLHFMKTGKEINKDDKISINGATVFLPDGISHKLDGYELPRNAITFNVPENGYINFFAGTYFPDNESFFSLHHIERDETLTKLKSIKEISKIYGKLKNGFIDETVPYIYGYTDDTFSEGTAAPSGYEIVFDTNWITDPNTININTNRIYYFEIPVNAGEFALGSVSDSDGAYLLYLDLAANGSRKVAEDPEHAIMGVNFIPPTDLQVADVGIYEGISASLSINEGVTAHSGVTAGYSRTDNENMKYQLSDTANFQLQFAGKGFTAIEDTSLISLSANLISREVSLEQLVKKRKRRIINLV